MQRIIEKTEDGSATLFVSACMAGGGCAKI